MQLFLFFILLIVTIRYLFRFREGLDSLDCSSAEKSDEPSLTCKKEDGNLNSNWVTGALKGFRIAAGFETESTPAYLPGTNPYNEEAPRTFEENTYGGDKALVEELLFNQYSISGWPVTIFRPQGVFGPYDTWQAGFIYYSLLHSLPIFVFEESKYRMNPLFVESFTTCFIYFSR